MVSINNTTQIDLRSGGVGIGRVAAYQRHGRAVAVRPGRLDASAGGKTFICLSSTYDEKGDRRSRIVLSPTQGNIVTTPRSDVMYVVTEYGIVNLKGKSVAERAQALISIAHPDFREDLERKAHEHRLIQGVHVLRGIGRASRDRGFRAPGPISGTLSVGSPGRCQSAQARSARGSPLAWRL